MNAYEAVVGRRTIHDYRPDPVPEEALDRALQAAIRAPNHKLTNPWRFTRIGPQTRSKIVEVGVELKTAGKNVSPEAEERVRKKLSGAPELLVVSQVRNPDPHRAREDYASVACAIENMMIVLWADGIGTKWSSGGVTTDPRTYELAGVDPQLEEIVGFVWIGYPSEVRETPRRALEEVYRRTA